MAAATVLLAGAALSSNLLTCCKPHGDWSLWFSTPRDAVSLRGEFHLAADDGHWERADGSGVAVMIDAERRWLVSDGTTRARTVDPQLVLTEPQSHGGQPWVWNGGNASNGTWRPLEGARLDMLPGWLATAQTMLDLSPYEANCPLIEPHPAVRDRVAELKQELERTGSATEKTELNHLLEWDHEHEPPYNILVVFIFFALGAYVRFLTRDTSLPYTVVIFFCGCAWGALGKMPATQDHVANYIRLANMDPHLIFFIFLPVLIFESAFAIDIPVFRKVVWQCLALAGPGLIAAATMTGLFAKLMFSEWTMPACLLFGVTLSATDPVAVVALLRELGASPLVSTLIEGESLFNDGTAIVFFEVLRGALQRQNCEAVWETCAADCFCEVSCSMPMTALEVLWEFCQVAFGGALVGLLMGVVAVGALNQVFNDPLVEITGTIVVAYVTFFICEGMLKWSGVLGLVTMGIFMANYRTCISPDTMHTLHEFWEIAAWLANTCVFTLAGMIVSLKAFENIEPIDVLYLLVIYVILNVVRVVVLSLLVPILRVAPCTRKYKLNLGNAALVAWGALRGAVGLVLALDIQNDEEVVVRGVKEKMIFHVAGIVLLTLLINGTTTQYVVAYFGLDAIAERRKLIMTERFAALTDEMREDVVDMGADPMFYDANWTLIHAFTDLDSLLKEGFENPYVRRGEEMRANSTDAERLVQRLEDGRIAYLNAMLGLIRKQEDLGLLGRRGVRVLQALVQSTREMTPESEVERGGSENPDAYMHHKSLEPLFNLRRTRKWFLMSMMPGLNETMATRMWTHAFDVCLSYTACHRLVANRINDLAEYDVANRVQTHCKRENSHTVHMLARFTRDHPDVSTCIKTKHACRDVLNDMRARLSVMKKDGRIDNQDLGALQRQIKLKMKQIDRTFPSTMQPTSAIEALRAAPWFQRAERACQRQLIAYVTELGEESIETIPESTPLCSGSPRMLFRVPVLHSAERKFDSSQMKGVKVAGDSSTSCPATFAPRNDASRVTGLYLVISGIVQLRIGRKIFLYGPGYTIGVQDLLTNSGRFSAVWAEKTLRLLYLPHSLLEPLLQAHPSFQAAMWNECGANAARCLMRMSAVFGTWGERLVRRTAQKGSHDLVQDPEHFGHQDERRMQLRPGAFRVLLRGRCWEYENEEEDEKTGRRIIKRHGEIRAPDLIPQTFKFATFTEHAVLYEMENPHAASLRAVELWRHLRAKVRSINLWSGLRGAFWQRRALALALGRSPPPSPGVDSRPTRHTPGPGSGLYAFRRQSRQLAPRSPAIDKPVASFALLRADSGGSRRSSSQGIMPPPPNLSEGVGVAADGLLLRARLAEAQSTILIAADALRQGGTRQPSSALASFGHLPQSSEVDELRKQVEELQGKLSPPPRLRRTLSSSQVAAPARASPTDSPDAYTSRMPTAPIGSRPPLAAPAPAAAAAPTLPAPLRPAPPSPPQPPTTALGGMRPSVYSDVPLVSAPGSRRIQEPSSGLGLAAPLLGSKHPEPRRHAPLLKPSVPRSTTRRDLSSSL